MKSNNLSDEHHQWMIRYCLPHELCTLLRTPPRNAVGSGGRRKELTIMLIWPGTFTDIQWVNLFEEIDRCEGCKSWFFHGIIKGICLRETEKTTHNIIIKNAVCDW